MLPLLILIVSQVFSPLQVISFKRSCFRCFGDSLLFIHTGSTEEPGVLLHPVSIFSHLPPDWAETPLLPLSFQVLLLFWLFVWFFCLNFTLLFCSCREKKKFGKPLAKSFCPERNLAREFPLNAYLCLSLRLAFRSLEWCFKGTKLYLKKGSIYIGLMLKTF